MADGSHLGFDPKMTLNRKINHTNEIGVFKNEVLHEILGLLCQNSKIQDGRRQPSCFDP